MGYHLATSVDDVRQYCTIEHPKNWVGVDTEGSSLNTRTCRLAGISMSLKAGTGIYIPIGHTVGNSNLPLMEVYEVLEEKWKTHTPVFQNAKYDLNVLQNHTKRAIKKFEDTLELIYMNNPDRKRKGLKEVCKTDIGFDMEKFETLFTPEEIKEGRMDIRGKDPRRPDVISYACADADGTLRLREHFDPTAIEQATNIAIDYGVIDVMRKVEHNGGMELNHEYIDKQIDALEKRAEALKEQIFRILGHTFEIDSPKQLGIALFDKGGMPSPGMTRGRNPIHVTKEESLEKLSKQYPVIECIISYKKAIKAKNSYFIKLKRLEALGIKPRFNFNLFAAPTFRFAAPGGDPLKDGATGVNIQAVSNGEARDMPGVNLGLIEQDGERYTDRIDDDDLLIDLRQTDDDDTPAPENYDELIMKLPYVIDSESAPNICIRETCQSCPARCASRGVDVTRRLIKGVQMVPSVRQAFRAPKGWTMVSFDYDRQELVIGANMCREPKWLRALAKNVDLHMLTAMDAFGLSQDQWDRLSKDEKKRKRGIGKILNFALFYGGTAYTLAMKADIPKQHAEVMYNGFTSGLPVLMQWMDKVKIFAKQNGYTTTYFGRKRYLADLYASNDRKIISFADRSAVNTAIQGTAAETTRIAIVKTAKRFEKEGITAKDAKFAIQIHDELAFLIRDEVVKEVVPVIKDAMEFKVKSWEIQLAVAPKIGRVWGMQEETTVEAIVNGELDEYLKAA